MCVLAVVALTQMSAHVTRSRKMYATVFHLAFGPFNIRLNGFKSLSNDLWNRLALQLACLNVCTSRVWIGQIMQCGSKLGTLCTLRLDMNIITGPDRRKLGKENLLDHNIHGQIFFTQRSCLVIGSIWKSMEPFNNWRDRLIELLARLNGWETRLTFYSTRLTFYSTRLRILDSRLRGFQSRSNDFKSRLNG